MSVKKDEFFDTLRKSVSEEFSHIPKEDEIDYEFSDKFDKKMTKLLNKVETNRTYTLSRTRKTVLALVAALIILLAGMMSVTAIRDYVIDLFVDRSESEYDYVSQNNISGDYEYALVEIDGETLAVITKYTGENESITIPCEIDEYEIYSIGSKAFADNRKIVWVKFDDGIKCIDALAFAGCSNLKHVQFPDSLVTIKSGAFADCDITGIVELGKHFGTDTEIDSNFGISENGSLSPFYNNPYLIGFDIDEDNPVLSTIDGVVFNKDVTSLIHYTEYRPGTNYTVPDTVDDIRAYAFCKAEYLEQIVMPVSVRTIGNNAFEGAKKLSSVTLSPNLKLIDNYAFSGCEALESITIPKSLSRINESVFQGCFSLSSIIVLNPNCDMNYAMFDDSVNSSEQYKNNTVTIYGYENSTAENFVRKVKPNNFNLEFKIFGEDNHISYLAVTENAETSVSLLWNEVDGVQVYQVYYSLDGLNWIKAVTTTDTSATITNLSPAQSYYFRVRARFANGDKGSFNITYSSTKPTSAANMWISNVTENEITVRWKEIKGWNEIECKIKSADGTKTYLAKTLHDYMENDVKSNGNLTVELPEGLLKKGEKYTVEVRAYKVISKHQKYCTLATSERVYGDTRTTTFTAK